MKNMILQFVRNKKGKRRGVFVAGLNDDNLIVIGWSFCHNTKDEFKREKGLEIAVGRASKSADMIYIPHGFKDETCSFIMRCKKYFKECYFKNELLNQHDILINI